MADLELELAQFSFSSAIRGHMSTWRHICACALQLFILNAATVQGRPLLRLVRVLCGAYSRAVFIRGAAFIQGNTVVHFSCAVSNAEYSCSRCFWRDRIQYCGILLRSMFSFCLLPTEVYMLCHLAAL